MRVSTKGRYALRMMLDLAQHYGEGYISLKDIADRQNISKKYLDQIMMLLKGNRFFKSSRGYQGGYKLAQEPKDYTLGEILEMTEGSLSPVACLDDQGKDCGRGESCKVLNVWLGLDKAIRDYVDNITLQDILDQNC